MATYSKAVGMTFSTLNVSIASNNGNINANQVIYTAPAGQKQIVELNGFYNTLLGAVNMGVTLQRKSPQTNSYFNVIGFNVEAPSFAANTPSRAYISQADQRKLSALGRAYQSIDSAYASSEFQTRIMLLPGDRLITSGGSCADGSNLRVTGDIETLASA